MFTGTCVFVISDLWVGGGPCGLISLRNTVHPVLLQFTVHRLPCPKRTFIFAGGAGAELVSAAYVPSGSLSTE